ncbi:MAG: hypothetical protein CHACPFDD_02648 [Phycisphaerae bacterium]|nr:hypothetical protein [Phycisphaerae bacterium]
MHRSILRRTAAAASGVVTLLPGVIGVLAMSPAVSAGQIVVAHLSADFEPGVAAGEVRTPADTFGVGTWHYLASQTLNPSDSGANLADLEWDASAQFFESPGFDHADGFNADALARSEGGSMLMHPRPAADGFVVARWQTGAAYSDGVRLVGYVRKSVAAEGDGVRVLVYVDGVSVLDVTLAPEDAVGQHFDLVAMGVEAGSTVDVVVSAVDSNDDDGTLVDLTIYRLTAAPNMPQPGDYLVISRTYGSLYALDPASGELRALLSGLELRDASGLVRGEGVVLSNAFTDALAINEFGRLVCRFARPTRYGLAAVDVVSGRRTVLNGTEAPEWDQGGDPLFIDSEHAFVTADGWLAGPTGNGRILLYDLRAQTTTLVSGDTLGDGPVLKRPRAMGMLDATTLVVVESGFAVGMWSGAGVYRVDVASGDRTFLSRLTPAPFERPMMSGGVEIGTVMLGDDEGGAGPVANLQFRTVLVTDGRILVGEAIGLPGPPWDGGLLEIDPITGDRTLLVGTALVDDGLVTNTVTELPSNASSVYVDAPIGLLERSPGVVAFVLQFVPAKLYEFDLVTRELHEIADVGTQIDPGRAGTVELSGLAVYRSTAIPGDANCDGSVNGFDVENFVRALSTPVQYQLDVAWCTQVTCDVNADGSVNGLDIDGFVELLTSP